MNPLSTGIEIPHMALKNRLVMPPMATAKAGKDGRATEALIEYYREKSADGHIGLIITEHCFVSPEGKAHAGQLSAADDDAIAGLRQIADAVHRNGSKIMAQISHAGSAADAPETMSASAVKMPRGSLTAPRGHFSSPLPREMTAADIEKTVRAFADAAARIRKAGFDGVEIHAAHGYLLNQFYSPLTNRRTDGYSGGTLSGRTRLLLEITAAVRNAVGSDFPVALRFGASDGMAGGADAAGSVPAARLFEKAGIDLLDVSGGFCGYLYPFSRDPGYFGEISKAIKDAVSIPVILTGGITDARTANRLLEEKKADLIGVGRAILRDSLWAMRAMTE